MLSSTRGRLGPIQPPTTTPLANWLAFSKKTTPSSKKGVSSKERWTDEGSIQLKPPVNWQIRIPILIVLLLPVFIAPGLSGIARVLACVMPLMLCGTFRITRVSDGWLRSRLFMGFIPVLTRKCKLAAVVYIGTKYGGDEPGVGTFVLFGPIQYFFGYIFDFLIPAMGGPYELSLETAKGREFIVWQGFNQEYFEKNLELLQNQTGAELKPK